MLVILLLVLSVHVHLTEQLAIDNQISLNKYDCNYKDARFGTIDLTRVGFKHDIPAFRHVLKDDYFYSYNPCYPFTEESPCTNIAICQINKNGSAFYALGINSLVSWSVSIDGKVTLVYSTVDRQAIVNLECWDELDQLVINGEYALRQYNFTLFSKCACWNGC